MGNQPLKVPLHALVMLIGPSASGKSTFTKHLPPHTTVSSDQCRYLVSGHEEDQSIHSKAFSVYHSLIDAKLDIGRVTVADATHLKKRARDALFEIAERHDRPVIGVMFDVDEETQKRWNTGRERQVPEFVLDKHRMQFASAEKEIREDPRFHRVVDASDYDSLAIELPEASGWDVISDVHGCHDELMALVFSQLRYRIEKDRLIHPDGRRLVFVGDLTDRGPQSDGVLDFCMRYVPPFLVAQGNHCNKLMRYLKGNPVKVGNGLQDTLDQIEGWSRAKREAVYAYLTEQPSHIVLKVRRKERHPNLVVSHAGIEPMYVGRDDHLERCLYGRVSGETDPDTGFPIRDHSWTSEWDGMGSEDDVLCVYGHTPVMEPDFRGKTVNIDTGCVFGGELTAFRYPEKEIVSVQAKEDYEGSGRMTP